MLLDWLKKDLSKDVAAIRALGGGLTSIARNGPVFGRGAQIAAASVMGVIGAVLLDPADPADLEKPKEVPYWDQGGTNDWHYRQWNFLD